MTRDPLVFLRALRRTIWHPGAPVPRRHRSRGGITIAPCWQVIATEAACQCVSGTSLCLALAEHDLTFEGGEQGERCGKRCQPRVTYHRTEEGLRFCVMSQPADALVRIALESERRAVIQEMQAPGSSPLDRKPHRSYSKGRIIVKPQRRKSGTRV